MKLVSNVLFALLFTIFSFSFVLAQQTGTTSKQYDQNKSPTTPKRSREMKPAPDYILTRVWTDSYDLGYYIADFFCVNGYFSCKEHWDNGDK